MLTTQIKRNFPSKKFSINRGSLFKYYPQIVKTTRLRVGTIRCRLRSIKTRTSKPPDSEVKQDFERRRNRREPAVQDMRRSTDAQTKLSN